MDRGKEDLPEAPRFISIITLYEFVRGKVDPVRAKRLAEEIFIVLPIDNAVVETASAIWRDLRRKGSPTERDLIIGATAISSELPLWTNNRKHFAGLKPYGLRFWSPETR